MKLLIKVLPMVLILGVTGCKKFLDVLPKGKAIPTTVDDFNGLFNNTGLLTFAPVQNTAGGPTGVSTTQADLAAVMSDDVFADSAYLQTLNTTSSYYTNAFTWSGDVYTPTDVANEWNLFYTHIFTYNVVANGVMNATDGTLTRKKELLAEARANRAFELLMLAGYFTRPFNASTAQVDPGVPIVTKDDITQTNFDRTTVQGVYNFIINELKAAIPDLPVQTINRARLAQSTGYYLLGETYFLMGDYANALIQLNSARNGLANSSIVVGLYDYNTMMTSWYSASQPWKGASGHPTQLNSQENVYVKSMGLSNFYNKNALFVNPSVLSLYTADDQRLKFFYNKNVSNGSITLPGYQRNSPNGFNWAFNLPNLYLMLAECKARQNDLAGAKQDLETLRKNRMPLITATVTISSQQNMVRLILDERQREFAGTGFRWFDMRRLSGDATYNNTTGIHKLSSTSFNLSPNRLVLRIPPYILSFNPGMADNP